MRNSRIEVSPKIYKLLWDTPIVPIVIGLLIPVLTYLILMLGWYFITLIFLEHQTASVPWFVKPLFGLMFWAITGFVVFIVGAILIHTIGWLSDVSDKIVRENFVIKPEKEKNKISVSEVINTISHADLMNDDVFREYITNAMKKK